MVNERTVINEADLIIGTGLDQRKPKRHWPAGLAMAVGPLLALLIYFLFLEQYNDEKVAEGGAGAPA